MSSSSKTIKEVKVTIQTYKSTDPKDNAQFYDRWAENYEKDITLLSYRSPYVAVDSLSENFTGSPEEALVLDVACGTGWVAKLMAELGFKNFVGVDGSKGMLELAAKTGLYQDLKLALLGIEPLPVQIGVYDVVIIAGALDAGFVPVSVIRELCQATKPGGFVCMARGNHRGAPANKYKEDLERELQLMEEEGLWSRVGVKHCDKYMEDPHLNPESSSLLPDEELYISGDVYVFKTSTNQSH